MRSKLFVPGSRPELFDKALRGDADALSFDLEDSVSEDRKADARAALQALLSGPSARACGKILIARVNRCGSVHFDADMRAVVQPGLALLNLPKVESTSEVLTAVTALEAAERANGVTEPVGLLLNIESARGLRLAYKLACAHPRVVGLQLGLGDLFEPLQIDRHEPASLHAVMLQMRLAAGEAGVFAYDAACANFSDAESFRAEANLARRLGYIVVSAPTPSTAIWSTPPSCSAPARCSPPRSGWDLAEVVAPYLQIPFREVLAPCQTLPTSTGAAAT